MDTSNETPSDSLLAWSRRNPGLRSLLDALEGAQAEALKGGLRFVMTSDALLVVGRLCSVGPDFVAMVVKDVAGGFKLNVNRPPGGSVALPPIASEQATLTAIDTYGAWLERIGFPAPLSQFDEGGLHYCEGYDASSPGIPVMPLELAQEMRAAAGAVRTRRVSTPVFLPDGFHGTSHVYDLRMQTAKLSDVLESMSLDKEQVAPVLIPETPIGGPIHYILTDGMAVQGGWMTWSDYGGNVLAQDFWSGKDYGVERAPAQWAYRHDGPRTLN